MGDLKPKHRPSRTPEGPYELAEGAGGAANLNCEMIRLLDFAEQLEQAGESILSLRRGREMRLIVHLVRHYLSGRCCHANIARIGSVSKMANEDLTQGLGSCFRPQSPPASSETLRL